MGLAIAKDELWVFDRPNRISIFDLYGHFKRDFGANTLVALATYPLPTHPPTLSLLFRWLVLLVCVAEQHVALFGEFRSVRVHL